MRSSSRGLKRKQNVVAFRDDLRVGVIYSGEMPRQHRGQVTDTLYVWNVKHKSRWVDRRDLPGLIKEFGIDNLDGEWIAEFKKHKAKREKKLKEPEPELGPEGEVEDDV